MKTPYLVVEDALSEALGVNLLLECAPHLPPPKCLRKDGFGYLRSNMSKWVRLAQREPVLILTDLDRKPCAPRLLSEWCGDSDRPQNLFFRIAVREVESWFMADHHALRKLIGPKGVLPPHPDELPDPKKHLLKLALLASREVRIDLLAQPDAVAGQGPGYNARLSALVRKEWSAVRASQRSPSLKRAYERLRQLSRV